MQRRVLTLGFPLSTCSVMASGLPVCTASAYARGPPSRAAGVVTPASTASTTSKAPPVVTTTSKFGSGMPRPAVRPLSGRQPQFCSHPPLMTSPSHSLAVVRRATTKINAYAQQPVLTVPIAKATPTTNASVAASRVLAAVALDLQDEVTVEDSVKMPTIAENKIFIEPAGKRRKKEPAVYNKVRGGQEDSHCHCK